MESKVCSKCKELLSIDSFYKSKTNNNFYFRSSCKVCHSKVTNSKENLSKRDKNKKKLIAKKWIENNKEQKSLIDKKYRLNNLEKVNNKIKNWIKNNKEKVRIYKNNEQKNYREKLNNTYIISLLVKRSIIKHDTIKQYPELIEAKRLQILTKRLCRTSQN